MDKILHISVVLLGVLWLICDLYALENNTTPNYGWFDFYFNEPYSSSSSNASRGSSTNPYSLEATSPSAWTKPEENNGQQNNQDAPRNNQSLPENTDPADLKNFLQLLLSALNLLNPDAEKPKDENPEIKTSNPIANQTERTTHTKRGSSDVPDDVEFENFSGDDENYYYEDDPVDTKANNNTTPKPTNNNLRKGNPDNETQTPAGVTENHPINNFDFNSTSSTQIPQVKTEQSEIKFTYNYRNIPIGSSVNQLPIGKPINVLIPPKIENNMYEIPYPFQRNNPENGFPFEYVPAPNLFANSYFIPNPFVDTNSNIPLDENINQPSNQQTPSMTGESKVFDPYIQYNQRYIPNIPYLSEYIPYLSEYIPISSNKPPDRNENIPNIANLPESHIPIANASEQYKPLAEAKPITSNTTPSNNLNTKTNNYNFQPINTNNRNPKLAPTVSSMIYILKNYNSPQKNESEKFPNIPNAVYAMPGTRQSPLISLQKTKPLNTSTNAEAKNIPFRVIKNMAPNLTDYNSKLPDKTPKLDNATVSNFTVPNQPPQQTILNKSNSSVPVENSTAPSNINPTTQQKTQFVTEQTIFNQTLGNFSNSGNFPKNQSLPAGNNINPFNPKGEVPQFNNTKILLLQINNTNGNSTANPRNNVTEDSGERNVSRNFPPTEQQAIKPIPLYIPTFPFFNTSLPEPEKSYQPDSYPYEDNDAYEPYDDYDDGALNRLLNLLKFMQEMVNTATAQTPQNTSDSTTATTSSILQTTPSNETIQIIPQNISSPHTNLSVVGLLNPVNSTTDTFKPMETYGSILEYIFKHSNNSLFISLKAPGNVTTQN